MSRFRRWLANLLWTPQAPTEPVEGVALSQDDLRRLTVALASNPAFGYITARFHNRRAYMERERTALIAGLRPGSDPVALKDRLLQLDAAIAENGWIERQLATAQNEFSAHEAD